MPTASTDDRVRIVVLLGGVNVGGHRLAMPVLRSVLEAVGCTEVVTYIQSGNAVVTPPAREPRDLSATLSEAITAEAGYHVPVVLRTATELAGVVDANPYPGSEGKQLHVVFFAEAPPATVLDGLDLASYLPEACDLSGRELYLHLPDGMGRAKLPVALTRAGRRAAPATASTSRNWNTVLRLLDLARS